MGFRDETFKALDNILILCPRKDSISPHSSSAVAAASSSSSFSLHTTQPEMRVYVAEGFDGVIGKVPFEFHAVMIGVECFMEQELWSEIGVR